MVEAEHDAMSELLREEQLHEEKDLVRGLKSRHIQMIAIGGAIGVGLFLGSARAIQAAGPALLLSYALVGIVIFFIMRALGELLLYRPVAGSFATPRRPRHGDRGADFPPPRSVAEGQGMIAGRVVATPLFALSGNPKTALLAPRTLKAPAFWKFSHLKNKSAPVSPFRYELVNTGV